MQILFLDAGPALRQLSARLADAGHTIQQVPDLPAAHAMLARADFDALVCDARSLDGDALLALQQARERHAAVPVVVVADAASAASAAQPANMHNFDYAVAPVSAEDVLQRLGEIASTPPNSLRAQMRRFEAQVILRTLEHADGDRRLAAQRLGIGLSSLYRKIEELDIRERVRAAH